MENKNNATAKVRINVGSGEIDIEGSEGFVRECLDQFKHLIQNVDDATSTDSRPRQSPDALQTDSVGTTSFGEYFAQFPKSLPQVDCFLIAALYVQNRSESNPSYSTAEANKLLIEQGVKVANASQCNKQLVGAKLAFKLTGRRFKIGQPELRT